MPVAHVNSKSLFYTLAHPTSSSNTINNLTILFIHGLGSSSSFYMPLMPHLLGQGYRCLTLDTHGSGSSPYTGSGNSIDSIASDACALLDSLNITEDVVLVGHSMGGIVASQLAANEAVNMQARFKAVVLIGPVSQGPEVASVFEKRIAIVEKDGMEPLAAKIPTAATGSGSNPLVHAFIRSLLLGNSPSGYISLCRAIAQATAPEYAKIKVPLLVIAGAEDNSSPLDSVRHIMEQYGSQKKEIRVLEGVGHWHVIEAYAVVQDAISSFLEEI